MIKNDYRRQAVLATRVDTNDTFQFTSIKEAIDYLKPHCPHLSPAVMTQCFNGKRKQCDGFTFSKIDIQTSDSISVLSDPTPISEESLSFTKNLILSPKGKPINNLPNTVEIIRNDPKIAGKLSFNEMTQEFLYKGEPIRDYVYDDIAFIVNEYLDSYTDQHIVKAVSIVCRENSFHPIKDIVSNLSWDGKPRLETVMIDILGAKDNKLNRALTIKWFYGLMKRLYEPGCNWDNMLIIHDHCGGTGKSTFAQRIAFDEFCSTNIPIDKLEDKDNVALMNHNWIINFDELARFDKSDMDRLKSFLTEKNNRTRLAYGRNVQKFDRHCVFYGSTNNDCFLRDYTDTGRAERRFWVIECEGRPHDQDWWEENFSDYVRDQILAEAYHKYISDPNFNYELTPEEQDLLYEVQCKYKTSNYDIELNSLVKSITEDKWPIDWSHTIYSFKSIYKDLSNGIRIQEDVNINAIPVDYIRNIFKYKPEGFITMAFNKMGWKKDIYSFNGEIVECYIRKGIKSNLILTKDGRYIPYDPVSDSNLF